VAGNVARKGELTAAYRVLVGKREGKRPLARLGYFELYFKMDHKEMGRCGVD
jgi:hypothetical protein